MKRHHFTRWGLYWKCLDRLTQAYGFGLTPEEAYEDCLMELEMSTSDIHK